MLAFTVLHKNHHAVLAHCWRCSMADSPEKSLAMSTAYWLRSSLTLLMSSLTAGEQEASTVRQARENKYTHTHNFHKNKVQLPLLSDTQDNLTHAIISSTAARRHSNVHTPPQCWKIPLKLYKTTARIGSNDINLRRPIHSHFLFLMLTPNTIQWINPFWL